MAARPQLAENVTPPPDLDPPATTAEAVDITIAAFQREVAEGAAKIQEGLAIWKSVEEHTQRWLGELPGTLKAQGSQITQSVKTVTEESAKAAKRMKGELLPPVEVIRGGKSDADR